MVLYRRAIHDLLVEKHSLTAKMECAEDRLASIEVENEALRQALQTVPDSLPTPIMNADREAILNGNKHLLMLYTCKCPITGQDITLHHTADAAASLADCFEMKGVIRAMVPLDFCQKALSSIAVSEAAILCITGKLESVSLLSMKS